ncbi:MAG: Asp-tRNA(Asn)/Glu-tRNA(Gln) amidotransferase GatCAB subunit B, partial [Saprospiraceae bacterium]|nr:Asp-tRNA(Asn)/Glu-tRNA(Gln) amidotransferase GatCAB subunit B [Saprospiraceae bacterium]
RYFPEPDLPPVELEEAYLEQIRRHMPALPWQVYEQLTGQYGLPAYDAGLLSEEPEPARYFEELCRHTSHYKPAANLIINKILPHCQEQGITLAQLPLPKRQLAALLEMIEGGQLSHTAAYQKVLPRMLDEPNTDPLQIARRENLIQTSDHDFLGELIDQLMADHPEEVRTYRNGKKALLGFFMGQLMRASKGKADPKAARELLQEKLGQS